MSSYLRQIIFDKALDAEEIAAYKNVMAKTTSEKFAAAVEHCGGVIAAADKLEVSRQRIYQIIGGDVPSKSLARVIELELKIPASAWDRTEVA